jgi:pimeloyl-ACP methyl ester carboxylesterase
MTPLSDELDDFDYRQSITSIDVPVFFISGEYDYNCPWVLVRKYCDVIDAPQKVFYKISGAAHSPLWENPEETEKALIEIKEMTLNG